MIEEAREKPARRQVNITLSEDDADLLDAIAFVLGMTPTETARDAIATFLALYADDTNVQDALLARQRMRKELAVASGKVARMSDARTKVRQPSRGKAAGPQ